LIQERVEKWSLRLIRANVEEVFTLDKSECKLVEFDKSELRLRATFDKSERLLGRDAVVRFATVADKPSMIE